MQFSKWHGLGNVYLLVERAELAAPLTPERVQTICDYHFGVGSDGILEVRLGERRPAEVVIWNPDGSTAEISGNGTRIAARWLARRERARTRCGSRVGPREVAAADARRRRRSRPTWAPSRWGSPRRSPSRASSRADAGRRSATRMRSSAASPDRDELLRLGPLVETHERFPERTNVQLVRVDGPHELTVGVWERGAGETLSSGTSAVAVARRRAPRLVREPGDRASRRRGPPGRARGLARRA